MGLLDRIALLLWRDVDGYQPETGGLGDHHNVSLRTRCRQARRWFAAGWHANWKWWVTTLIATSAAAAAIVPLYINAAKPAEQVKSGEWELLLKCVEQRKCIVRVEPFREADDHVITGTNSERRDQDGPALKK